MVELPNQAPHSHQVADAGNGKLLSQHHFHLNKENYSSKFTIYQQSLKETNPQFTTCNQTYLLQVIRPTLESSPSPNKAALNNHHLISYCPSSILKKKTKLKQAESYK